MSDPACLIAVGLVWLLYGIVHSILAASAVKTWVGRRWPGLAPSYRALFNGLALLWLLPPLWLTWNCPGPALWHWPAWLSWGAALVSVAGYLWSLSWYDGLEFIGLRQWRQGRGTELADQRLVLSPLHRYVRHPWYSLGLLFLWTRDLNAAWLVATLVITLYLVAGLRLEERKLLMQFGDPYRHYMARVPALVPRPWRRLKADEVESCLNGQDQSSSASSS